MMDIRTGLPYVGEDGSWCFYTDADITAYNQGGKDAYYGRQNRLYDGDYAQKLTPKARELYRAGYDDQPFGRKDY